MMQRQLAAQQTNNSNSHDYIEAMKLAHFEQLEKQLEATIVERYNNATGYNQIGGDIGKQYFDIVQRIEKTLQEGKSALNEYNELIALFKRFGYSVEQIQQINDTQQGNMSVSLNDLINIQKLCNFVQSKPDPKQITNTLNSLLSAPSELLNLIIAIKAEGVADKEVAKVIKKLNLLGESAATVEYTFGTEKRKVITKAADIRYKSQNVKWVQSLSEGGGVIDIQVENYGSVKAYRKQSGSGQNLTNMTSYKNSNAILIPMLKQLYYSHSNNLDQTNYQIYNTLAFDSKNGREPGLDKNYRIMRSDLIVNFVEKFLIGFNDATAQRLIIHNFVAYPTLSILSAIAKESGEQTSQGDLYGHNSNIFNVYFGNAQSENTWEGERNILNEDNRLKRIKKVKAAIEKLQVKGRMNFDSLDIFIKTHGYEIGGLNLKGIVPQLAYNQGKS